MTTAEKLACRYWEAYEDLAPPHGLHRVLAVKAMQRLLDDGLVAPGLAMGGKGWLPRGLRHQDNPGATW